jgi:hypothetical protein
MLFYLDLSSKASHHVGKGRRGNKSSCFFLLHRLRQLGRLRGPWYGTITKNNGETKAHTQTEKRYLKKTQALHSMK